MQSEQRRCCGRWGAFRLTGAPATTPQSFPVRRGVQFVDRLEELRAMGLSATLLQLAAGDFPHPEFEFRCSPVHRFFSMVPVTFRPAGFVPLWECGETVVGCRRGEAGP